MNRHLYNYYSCVYSIIVVIVDWWVTYSDLVSTSAFLYSSFLFFHWKCSFSFFFCCYEFLASLQSPTCSVEQSIFASFYWSSELFFQALDSSGIQNIFEMANWKDLSKDESRFRVCTLHTLNTVSYIQIECAMWHRI